MKGKISVFLFPIYIVILTVFRLISHIMLINFFLDVNISCLIWMLCLYTFKYIIVNDKLFKLSLVMCYSFMFVLLHRNLLIS